VAAIEPLWLRRVAIVADRGLTGGAFPRHQGITSVWITRTRVWRGILGGTKSGKQDGGGGDPAFYRLRNMSSPCPVCISERP
jgi:hypothetical protein